MENSSGQKSLTERRQHRRIRYSGVIEFLIATSARQEPNYGMTVNISASGLCFYTPVLLTPRETIKIRSYSFRLPCEEATVIWGKEVNASLYSVGVKFLNKT